MRYRGFDDELVSRVQRASGDRHYFDRDTLEFFDSYAGEVVSRTRDEWVIVESVRPPHDERMHRVIRVTFTDDGRDAPERVTIDRVTDNKPSAQLAVAAWSRRDEMTD